MNKNIESLLNQELDDALLAVIEAEDGQRAAERKVEDCRAAIGLALDAAKKVRKGLNALTGRELNEGEINSQINARKTELRRQAS